MRATLVAGVGHRNENFRRRRRAPARRRRRRRRDCRPTPRSPRPVGTSAASIRLNAPRGLKLPACCSSSSLSDRPASRPQLPAAPGGHRACAGHGRDARRGGGDVASVNSWRADAGTARPRANKPLPFRHVCGPECIGSCRFMGAAPAATGDGVLLMGPPGTGQVRPAAASARSRLRAGGGRQRRHRWTASPPGAARWPDCSRCAAWASSACRTSRWRALAVVVDLARPPTAAGAACRHPVLDLPRSRSIADAASAPERVALALDCALGRVTQLAGAFAA